MTVLGPCVSCGSAPSPRLLRAMATFGLFVRQVGRPRPPRPEAATARRILTMPGGSVALVQGPSGCGKSTLLAAVAEDAAAQHHTAIDAGTVLRDADQATPIIDLFDAALADALGLLAAAGLAEPKLWARSTAELSEGQRLRLGIALAMQHADRRTHTLLVIDEFGSALDRPTAYGVARTVRRWASTTPGVRVLCATAHDDLGDALRPDMLINLQAEGKQP